MPELDIAAIAADAVVDTGAPPPGEGETQGSPPASVETTVQPADEPSDAEKAEKAQSRKDARRFAQLRRELSEKDREIGRLQGLSEARTATPSADKAGPPKQSDFNNFDDWLAARDEYLLNQATEKFSKVAGVSRGDTEHPNPKGQAFWDAAAKEAKEKGIEGYAEAAEAIQTGEIVTSPAMSHYVIEEADNKAALVAWLADNPDDSERIAKLDPVRAGAALAKVDASLGAKPRQVSSAPAPVPQPSGGGTASLSIERMGHEDIRKMVGKWSRGR